MMSVCARVLGAGLLLAVGCGETAKAVPIVLEYHGVVTGGDMPTVNVGDTIIFKVFADNGGTGLASQTWTWEDVTGATFQAGVYSATTSGQKYGDDFSQGGFRTDATGHLSELDLLTVTQDGTDTINSSILTFFMGSGAENIGAHGIWFDGNGHGVAAAFPVIGNTTIALAPTPIPATLPLLGAALGGLGFAAWRRTRALPRQSGEPCSSPA